MAIPNDYAERVYAGVLGKIIGVYLGRPFEGWQYDRIMRELGEVRYYVNDWLKKPLIVTDDDISGTFSFLRALPDHGNSREITAEEIGNAWLNYIIERRTILWWGGLGNSTEHTAYLRLKEGIAAPRSGSIELNGATVAEQIGAEIFIDGWAMVAPGDPELAAELARKAGSVSHDGEALFAAQLLAAMEAMAFVESDIEKLLDTGLGMIPENSMISRVVRDVRSWHAGEKDWKVTRQRIADTYGYDKFPGHVHVVPNHAVIILALLYGKDDFQRSLMIANTSGWDTDCNSGNVGCLVGIKNGLGAVEAGPDWRGPVADRLYLSTADGGRGITDAVKEALEIVSIGKALAGEGPMQPTKGGAQFHFAFPGSVQGFTLERVPELYNGGRLTNVEGHSETGERSLAISYDDLAEGQVLRAVTPTFIPPEAIEMANYKLFAAPRLYPGQTVRVRLESGRDNRGVVEVQPVILVYGPDEGLIVRKGPACKLEPGGTAITEWKIEETGGQPIASVGIELTAERRSCGNVYLDYLSWDGPPDVRFTRPEGGGTMWRRSWVDAMDHFEARWPEPFSVSHDDGVGLLSTGGGDWTDYEVEASVSTDLAKEWGIAARVGGLLRFYALLLTDEGKVQLVKQRDIRSVLASEDFTWSFGRKYTLTLCVSGDRLTGRVDGEEIFSVRDSNNPISVGGIALVCTEGQLVTNEVTVRPVRP